MNLVATGLRGLLVIVRTCLGSQAAIRAGCLARWLGGTYAGQRQADEHDQGKRLERQQEIVAEPGVSDVQRAAAGRQLERLSPWSGR